MVFNALADLFSPQNKRAREELEEQQERGDDHLLPGSGKDFYKGKITLKRLRAAAPQDATSPDP